MNKTVIVNIYNFIRMSHVEPSRFIFDDFETIRNQLITVKQYGFPGTYALKYDALMDPQYQELLKTWLDENDEISAWWEITEPLCIRAKVPFRGHEKAEEHDDRVNSAYSIGYAPGERKRLVDAYMADFRAVFGQYPRSIGSWVLDSITMAYARDHYGVEAAAICRDQMGVDGFTLWGGWPNGAYYPSRNNEFIPAKTLKDQLDIPVFRLLGPDPIYNFEAEVRENLQGVYTLEPSWLIGRDPRWIRWFFERLCDENALGMGYAHVGQENNFLWENIRPGFAPQLDELKRLSDLGKIRVETMADSARWFRSRYKLTPPLTFQASEDWDTARNLSAQWYAGPNYRLGFLGEEEHLRIRDFFVFDEKYPSRYLQSPMKGTASTFDALPILFPQRWTGQGRPYIRLTDEKGQEPSGTIQYTALDALTAQAELREGDGVVTTFTMMPNRILIHGPYHLAFDTLPVFLRLTGNQIWMTHQGFEYCMEVEKGTLLHCGKDGLRIMPQSDEISLRLGRELGHLDIFTDILESHVPEPLHPASVIPAFAPEFFPGDSVFPWGTAAEIQIFSRDGGEIRYTLDGTEPTPESSRYTGALTLTEDTLVLARAFLSDGRVSDLSQAQYRFGLKDLTLTSPTQLDRRPVFHGNGLMDLLGTRRATLDYIDGCWRGTLQDLDICCTLSSARKLRTVSIGFLSHHRSGIVYPESVSLYIGPDADHLTLREQAVIPNVPGKREIEKMDVTFQIREEVGAFRILARRHERMPQWCAYHGSTVVFTMTDSLIVTPEE